MLDRAIILQRLLFYECIRFILLCRIVGCWRFTVINQQTQYVINDNSHEKYKLVIIQSNFRKSKKRFPFHDVTVVELEKIKITCCHNWKLTNELRSSDLKYDIQLFLCRCQKQQRLISWLADLEDNYWNTYIIFDIL